MPMKNTATSYGWPAKAFHWLIGLTIIGLLGVGLWMEDLEPPFKYEIYGLHKATGIVVLALAALRLAWKGINPSVLLPEGLSRAKQLLAKVTHILLYVGMFAMPISGWAMSNAAGHSVSIYGLFTIPALVEKNKMIAGIAHEAHELIGYGLMALIGLHVLAAIYHHVILKDNVLKRMLPGG
jgi:cytochrome b561